MPKEIKSFEFVKKETVKYQTFDYLEFDSLEEAVAWETYKPIACKLKQIPDGCGGRIFKIYSETEYRAMMMCIGRNGKNEEYVSKNMPRVYPTYFYESDGNISQAADNVETENNIQQEIDELIRFIK